MVTTAAENIGTGHRQRRNSRWSGWKAYVAISRSSGATCSGRRTGTVKAVDGISINIMPGETYSLVGESGCGKTTTSRMLLMADQPTEGNIYFDDRPMKQLPEPSGGTSKPRCRRCFRTRGASLNPRMRVDQIVANRLITHQRLSRSAVRAQVQELLQVVGLHPFHAERYPHEFSGGQRQRIAIARALSTRPKLIVLDEPVSALDVSIRAQILNLLKQLQETYELSYLLIAHNLATVRYMSHMVGVMYLGKIVEEAPPIELFTNAQHPYTRALILPRLCRSSPAPTRGNCAHGRSAVAVEPAVGMHLPPPLSLRDGSLFRGRAGAGGLQSGTLHRVPLVRRWGRQYLLTNPSRQKPGRKKRRIRRSPDPASACWPV